MAPSGLAHICRRPAGGEDVAEVAVPVQCVDHRHLRLLVGTIHLLRLLGEGVEHLRLELMIPVQVIRYVDTGQEAGHIFDHVAILIDLDRVVVKLISAIDRALLAQKHTPLAELQPDAGDVDTLQKPIDVFIGVMT